MGLITEAPLALLRKQMELHGTVVWDDPERAHVKLTAGLTAEKVSFKPLGVFSLSAVGCLLAAYCRRSRHLLGDGYLLML
jgi:hypothetical protein